MAGHGPQHTRARIGDRRAAPWRGVGQPALTTYRSSHVHLPSPRRPVPPRDHPQRRLRPFPCAGYAAALSGTLDGDDSGTVSLYISDEGDVTGSYVGEGGSGSFFGLVSCDGGGVSRTMSGEGCDGSFSGYVSEGGGGSGSWSNDCDSGSYSGTWSVF